MFWLYDSIIRYSPADSCFIFFIAERSLSLIGTLLWDLFDWMSLDSWKMNTSRIMTMIPSRAFRYPGPVYMFSLNLMASIPSPSDPRGTNINPRAEDRRNSQIHAYMECTFLKLQVQYICIATNLVPVWSQDLEQKWSQPVPQFSPSLWWLQTHMTSPQLSHLA